MLATEATRPGGGSVARWIRAHPIGAFLIWFFSVGWAIAFVPVVAKSPLRIELPLEPFLIGATWLGLLVPAVVITWLVDGKAGVQEMGRRVLRVRASLGWYLLAILAVPLTALVLAIVMFGPPTGTPSTILSAFVNGLLLQTVIGFITINLWEETAWMGFIQTRLQAQRGVIVAAVLTAGLFTLQHVPLAVQNGAGIVIIMPVLFLMAIPFRASLAWIYNCTGSLFLVGLLHAAGDATGSGALGDGLLPRLYENSDIGLLPMLAEVLVGIVIIAATRARLGSPARAPQVAQPVTA